MFFSCTSVQFSPSVVSDFLWPHGPQHTRSPCPSPTPGAYSNSCPSSQWRHPTISSSVVPFSSHLQFVPVSGSFPMIFFFLYLIAFKKLCGGLQISDETFCTTYGMALLTFNCVNYAASFRFAPRLTLLWTGFPLRVLYSWLPCHLSSILPTFPFLCHPVWGEWLADSIPLSQFTPSFWWSTSFSIFFQMVHWR